MQDCYIPANSCSWNPDTLSENIWMGNGWIISNRCLTSWYWRDFTFWFATCSILICSIFLSNLRKTESRPTNPSTLTNEWFLSHFGWVTLASIPLYTVGTAVCFYGKGYNFVEYLVLNIFKAAQRLIVQIIFLPFIFLVKQSLDVETIILVIYLIDIGLNFWTNIQFFDTMKPGAVILRSFISHLILLMLMFLVIFIIMLIAPYF